MEKLQITTKEKIVSSEKIDLKEAEGELKKRVEIIDELIEKHTNIRDDLNAQLQAIDKLRHYRKKIVNLGIEIRQNRQQYGESMRRVHFAIDNLRGNFTIKDVEKFLEENNLSVKKSTIQVNLMRCANNKHLHIVKRARGRNLNVYSKNPSFQQSIVYTDEAFNNAKPVHAVA